MKKTFLFLGVLGISLSAIFVRGASAPSLVLAFYRMGFSALLLLPYCFHKCRRELRGLHAKDWLLAGLSGLFLGLHFAAYFESLRFTTIASSVVLVDAEVIFVAAGMYLLTKERLSPLAGLGALLALGGSAVIASGDFALGGTAFYGDLLALSGALFMAVYTMIGRLLRQRLSTAVYTLLVYIASALTLLIALLLSNQPLTGHGPEAMWAGLGMAVFCTLLGHSVFSWGLKYFPASYISTVKMMEPIFASLLGLLIFAEAPGFFTLLGGVVVLAGVWLCARHT